jgi:hypothetical protein
MPARTVLFGTLANATIASANVASNVILACYDWEVEIKTDEIDATGHGDAWKSKLMCASEWTFRAKAYVWMSGTSPVSYGLLWSKTTTPALATINAYSTGDATGAPIFSGVGFPKEFKLAAPMALVTQEFLVCGKGAPTAGISA